MRTLALAKEEIIPKKSTSLTVGYIFTVSNLQIVNGLNRPVKIKLLHDLEGNVVFEISSTKEIRQKVKGLSRVSHGRYVCE